jgi:hypothetical protein
MFQDITNTIYDMYFVNISMLWFGDFVIWIFKKLHSISGRSLPESQRAKRRRHTRFAPVSDQPAIGECLRSTESRNAKMYIYSILINYMSVDTVTIMIVITPLGIILGNYKFLIPFNVISEEFNKNKATVLEFTTKIDSRIAKIEQFVRLCLNMILMSHFFRLT